MISFPSALSQITAAFNEPQILFNTPLDSEKTGKLLCVSSVDSFIFTDTSPATVLFLIQDK